MKKKTLGGGLEQVKLSFSKGKMLAFVGGLVLLFVVVFGTSYALLTSKLIGKRNYAVEIGNLDFSINQEDNGIRLLNAFPMNDEYGKTLNPYTFSLTNTGTIEEDYTITLVEDEEEKKQCNGCEFLKPNKLHYELKVNGVSKGAKMLTSSTRLDYGTLGVGETNNYELRIWLKESATIEEANKYYYGRIKVDATQTEKKEFPKYNAMMMARTSSYSTDYFWKYSNQITSIVFEPAINIPEGAENWDVSATTNLGQVMAYVEDLGETVTVNSETLPAYKLHIQAQNGVAANTNSFYLFSNFVNLTSIDGLSYLDTSNVTNMQNMFFSCNNLTSLDVSNFDTSNVTNMQNMFSRCRSLVSLDVSNFNTSKVTNMGSMFSDCVTLTSLNLNNFDTSSVTDMSSMFSNCSSLTNLDVSNFDTSKVRSMYSMFGYCNSIENLDLNHFNTSNVTNMGGMFAYSNNIVSIHLESFETSKVTVMYDMFRDCKSLVSLDLSGFDTSNVTNFTCIFLGCNSLIDLDISNFNTTNITSMNGIFQNCNSLVSLDLSSFDTSNVTNMNNMFSGCSSLVSLDLSSFDTSNVTNMAVMFARCSSLISLDLSNFNTSKVTNMATMFQNCSSLTFLDISDFDVSNVTSSSVAFNGLRKNPVILVKDEATKTWVLKIQSDLENVQVKSA